MLTVVLRRRRSTLLFSLIFLVKYFTDSRVVYIRGDNFFETPEGGKYKHFIVSRFLFLLFRLSYLSS